MFDFDWGDILGAGSSIIGSVLSNNQAEATADRATASTAASEARLNEASARLQRAMTSLEGLTPPNLLDFVQPFQRAVAAGQLTPEEATFKMAEASKMNGITIPPEILSAQQSALSKITAIAEGGGLTAMDRARLLDIQDEQAARSRGEQEAIVQNAQQRGVAGTGIEQASRLLSQQGAATRSARAGTDVAADAQRRALEAIQASGTLSGTMRNQAFSEQSQKAAAQDAIDKFNTSFQNQTNAANVAARNTAQAANLQEKQRLQEYNIGQGEREAAARAAAAQSNWQNTFNKGTALTNAAAGQATTAQNASIAANTAAERQLATADAQRAAAIQQAGQGIGGLVKLWDKED